MALKDLVPTIWGTRNVPIRRQDDEHPFHSLQRNVNRIFDDFSKASKHFLQERCVDDNGAKD